MIIAWTGHRPDLFRDAEAARTAVTDAAREFARAGAAAFLVGGQRGVDTWAALAAMDLAVPFTVLLPHAIAEFTQDWREADRSMLEHTMTGAREVQVLGGYTLRNRALATSAQLLVAVWTRTAAGGTAETLDLARQAGTPVREIVLAPASTAPSTRGRGI